VVNVEPEQQGFLDDGDRRLGQIKRSDRQIFLQQCLDYIQPGYLHVPLVLDPAGRKLSKSEGAAELNPDRPVKSIHAALSHLGQQPPADLVQAGIVDVWQWALENWNISNIPTSSGVIQI